MRSGLITRSVGGGAVLAAIATVGSFLTADAAFWWAIAAAALRAAVLVGLGHDMGIHVGAWRLRWFAYLCAALEVAFIVLSALHIPIEAHFGVEGVAPHAGHAGAIIGFVVWLLYGVVTAALGIACVGVSRYRAFGIFMIVAGVAWLLVLTILVWPFIVALALLALAYRLLRPSIASVTG